MSSQEPLRTFDQAILSAWQKQVKTTHKRNIRQQCLQREPELLLRFGKHYEKLKTLLRRMQRGLQRQWKWPLVVLALLLMFGYVPARAATITVGEMCKLVDAISSANTDTARGGCAAGSGADTIELSSGSTLTLTAVDNVIYGPTGLPVIGSVITIVGNGSTITRAGSAPEFRIFAVAPSGNLTLRQVTLSGGIAPKAGSEIANDGGGVLNAGGTLSIIGSTMSGNAADRGGAVQSQSSAGRVKVVIASTTITNNKAVAGTERTSGWGGGVDVDANTDLNISNSTISNNTAETIGGAIYLLTGTNIIMTNSTLTGNSAVKRAGGVATGCATLDLDHNLISGNTAPVASEMSTSAPGCQVASLNFNLFGHSGLTNGQAFNNFTPGATDITATSDGNTPKALNAILNPTLANNGGFTQTHALVMGSPAVDVITDGTCPPPVFDERGVTRPQGAGCDIGAFELAQAPVQPGTLQFSTAAYEVSEAGGTATITVTRVNGSVGAVSVGYTTATGGTATEGADYTFTSGLLGWANGDTASKTFTVPIIDDTDVEGNETVNLILSNPDGGATLGLPNTAVLTIVDNDAGVTCGGLAATIVGTAGDEAILGTSGPDVIDGLGGVDTIQGLVGNDVLCGGMGNDTILSGRGNDRAFGEIGNDLVRGGRGADQVHGGSGVDQLFGDENNDGLTGGTGTDRCDGGIGNDTASTCETRISIETVSTGRPPAPAPQQPVAPPAAPAPTQPVSPEPAQPPPGAPAPSAPPPPAPTPPDQAITEPAPPPPVPNPGQTDTTQPEPTNREPVPPEPVSGYQQVETTAWGVSPLES